MRLPAQVLAALLTSTVVFAQDVRPSSTQDAGAGQPATAADTPADSAKPLDLPVSLDRIREQLANPPAEPLRGLDEKPLFKVEIREKQKFEDLVSRLKFETGPQVPGGLYMYEQQQAVWSKQQNPEMQPYGAFNQGQLATILFEQFLEKYLGGRIVNALSDSARAQAQEAAHDEVQQALADFWSYQAQQSASDAAVQQKR